jgi:opacity protein-like surface antigen
MRKMLLCLFAALALASTTASAQVQSVEIVPFGGYRWSGGISSLSLVSEFDVKDAAAYGVCLDFNMPRNSAAELYWSHWSGDWEATLLAGGTPSGSFSRDDILLNGIWYAARPGAAARPYVTAGIGASIFYSDNSETVGRFAWSLGAGVRRDLNEKLGLRLDFRWPPAWITTGSTVWCDPYWGGCYPVETGEFFDQWELTGGLIIKP